MQEQLGPRFARSSVSVIIPTYKRARFIGETINSVLAQDMKPLEIIVVNDGSPDDTESIVGLFPDPVRMIRIPNVGATGAREAGISVANGDWIAFCDDDDLWETNHLSRLFALVIDHNVLFAFSNFTHLRGGKLARESHFESDRSGFWMQPGRPVGDQTFVTERPLLLNILEYQVIFPSCVLFSREFLRRVGGLNAAFGRNAAEDLEFTLRCSTKFPLGIDTRPTVHIRRHDKNSSADWIKVLAGSIEILDFFLEDHNLSFEHKDAIRKQIIYRSIIGIDCSFLARRFSDIAYFTTHLHQGAIPFKTTMKIAISRQPQVISKPLSSALIALRNLMR